MPKNLPLEGKTIILTGSPKTQSIAPYIESNGGLVKVLPLIEVKEYMNDLDTIKVEQLNNYEWLIFTSQNAVVYFMEKLKRYGVVVSTLQNKIAAVGEKTATALQAAGFLIDFMPSVYSADIFIQEFHHQGKALFVRGSLAKATITTSLGADEWTVYETISSKKYITAMQELLTTNIKPIIIFASPSAVRVYAKDIAQNIGWKLAEYATIGHVTTKALEGHGVSPIVQPNTYTMQAVIKQIILEEVNK